MKVHASKDFGNIRVTCYGECGQDKAHAWERVLVENTTGREKSISKLRQDTVKANLRSSKQGEELS